MYAPGISFPWIHSTFPALLRFIYSIPMLPISPTFIFFIHTHNAVLDQSPATLQIITLFYQSRLITHALRVLFLCLFLCTCSTSHQCLSHFGLKYICPASPLHEDFQEDRNHTLSNFHIYRTWLRASCTNCWIKYSDFSLVREITKSITQSRNACKRITEFRIVILK